MEVKRVRAPRTRFFSASPASPAAEEDGSPELQESAYDEEKKRGGWRSAARPEMVLLGFFITLPLLVFLFGGRWGSFPPSSSSSSSSSSTLQPLPNRTLHLEQERTDPSTATTEPEDVYETPVQDELLGGLLSDTFPEASCLSRYRSSLYRQPSPFPLSPYLVDKLRKYEALHKKCGPGTQRYQRAIKQLNSGRNSKSSKCKYVVWFPCNGLGNRMLTLASTFLYGLLTNRVLLKYMPKESDGLFCEPFPESTWVLPSDFPRNNIYDLHPGNPDSYANMLQSGRISNTNMNASASSLPAYVYLHLEQSQLHLGDHIFCDNDQMLLNKFNWMILKSDSYFAPALFLTPMFKDELAQMFPAKESVFHHLGRYLFHPTNQVWGIIHRYYEAYLAKADEKIGFQIRIFREKPIPFESMYDQVIRCIREQHLLPELSKLDPVQSGNSSSGSPKVTAALITSLYPGYYEKIRGMYYENPTVSGEIVAVYQPSHEEEQQTEAQMHNQKALAEIYLLSYCDKIVITAWSTFGYVATSFAGLKPWIFLRPAWNTDRADVACIRGSSVEPCLHSPPILDCQGKNLDPSTVVPHVRHCEDVGMGLKLYDS